MGIATVRGKFGVFEGKIYERDVPVLQGSVDVSTIDTNRQGEPRRALKSRSSSTPTIRSRSPSMARRARPAATPAVMLKGEITIKGITKPIERTGELAENGQDPWGNDELPELHPELH